MKQLILSLLFIPGLVRAQSNNGQDSENNALKLSYVSAGVVSVTNKQACTLSVELSNCTLNSVTVPAGQSVNVISLSNSSLVKAKPTNRCSSTMDMGWVEYQLSFILPITYGSVKAKYVGNRQVQIDFDSYNTTEGTSFIIEYSLDGNIWKRALIFNAEGFSPKHYTKIINL